MDYFLTREIKDAINNSAPALQQADVGGLLDKALAAGIPFDVKGVITAAAAGTPVVLLPDNWVPAGYQAILDDFYVRVKGATAWSGGSMAHLFIEDTGGSSALGFLDIAVAALTGNAILSRNSSNVTLLAGFSDIGATVGCGIQVVANANAGAGSDVAVRIMGHIKPV